MNQETLIIGLTGGIGSGKTTAAKMLAKMGYPIISTDLLAKIAMEEYSDIKEKIMLELGNDTYTEGLPNQKIIASKVFGPGNEKKANLRKLNSIVHPAVIDMMINEIEFLTESSHDMIFVESALIFEAGLDEGFDYIIDIHADRDICIKRILDRSGSNLEDAENRLSSQMSPEEKKKLSDFIINNNKSKEELQKSVEFTLNILKSMPPKDFKNINKL